MKKPHMMVGVAADAAAKCRRRMLLAVDYGIINRHGSDNADT